MDGQGTQEIIRFSVFEANLETGELFKRGLKVKLQEQPFQLLVELLKNAGAVVTREHLKEKLWPGETAGEFDSGLNRAINRIREVLGDSAESPSFIETLPRRGYRFVGPVLAAAPDVVVDAPKAKPFPQPIVRRWKPTIWIASTVALLLAVFWFVHSRQEPPLELKLRQLTTHSIENPISHAAISPDGNYLAYGDLAGIRLQEISTGQTHALPTPNALTENDAWFPTAWFPDGTHMLATALTTDADGRARSSVWSAPVLGNAIQLRDDAFSPAVAPNGSTIAFIANRAFENYPFRPNLVNPWGREIWIMGPNGENARKLVSNDGETLYACVQWSPGGKLLAYIALHTNAKPQAKNIEAFQWDGGASHVLMRDFDGFEFRWLRDGHFLYQKLEPAPNERDSNLWSVAVNPESGKTIGSPRQVTKVPGFSMFEISASSDGKKAVVLNLSESAEVYIGELKTSGQMETPRRLTQDDHANMPFDWTADSKSVIFVSDRTGVTAIYRQEINQELAELIPTGVQPLWVPRVTPDGSSIVYLTVPDYRFPLQSAGRTLMRLPISGGARQVVQHFPNAYGCNLDCPKQAGRDCIIEVDSVGAGNSGSSVFFAFDPLKGPLKELFRQQTRATYANWTVSPDGSHLAKLQDDNSIGILSLNGQLENTIHVNGWPYLVTLDWQADGEALFSAHEGPNKTTLLRVGLDGKIQPLWATNGLTDIWAVASPNGRYLAIKSESSSRNAWMVEGF